MTISKRIFDIILAIILSIILLPLIIVVTFIVLVLDGRPIFYISERMKTPTKSFFIIKFRTMKPVENDSGVSGADKRNRITPIGKFLRKSRLDELPQLWNVFKGDISFVGPRPPLRQYVESYPEIYGKVLKSRPGITGMATVWYHAHEEMLIGRSNSSAETNAIYTRACIPRKARLDLIYQNKRNICIDVWIMLATVFKSLR